MLGYDEELMVRRAWAAYFRGVPECAVKMPSWDMCEMEAHNGKAYVLIRNSSETLAVYRVKPDGILKRLRRYPKQFEEF